MGARVGYRPRHVPGAFPTRTPTDRGADGPPRRGRAPFLLVLILVLVGGLAALQAEGRIHLLHPSAAAGSVPGGTGSGRAPGAGGDSVGAAMPHHLSVISHPEGATVTVTEADGTILHGTTPFGTEAVGRATVRLTMHGRNPLSEEVTLDHNRTLDRYLDPTGQLLHEIGTLRSGSAPKQVAFTPDGSELWVTDLAGDGVEVFDARTLKRIDDIKLGADGAVEVIFNRAGTRAYASQMETASVFEIDTSTRTVLRQMMTYSSWSKYLALSPDERTLYVANWSGDNVTELDLGTGTVRRQIRTVDTPRGLYVTPDGKRLFVAGFGAGQLQRITLATGASKILLSTGGAMRHLVGDPSRGLLYADDMARDEVFVVDLATERVRMLAKTDHTPNTMDLSPDGKVLYVSNRGANNPVSYYLPGPEWGSVLALDTTTGKPLDAIIGGNQTTGLDVSPDGTTLAYSDFLDNRVTLYAIPAYRTLAAGGGGRYRAHLAELGK